MGGRKGKQRKGHTKTLTLGREVPTTVRLRLTRPSQMAQNGPLPPQLLPATMLQSNSLDVHGNGYHDVEPKFSTLQHLNELYQGRLAKLTQQINDTSE